MFWKPHQMRLSEGGQLSELLSEKGKISEILSELSEMIF
jgi:hypothetical protein